MNKVAHYLQEHLVGEIIASADARRYFSTDGSIFTVVPTMIVYPKNENDVRKVSRFTWQLAERGRVMPITARGLGTDKSGAAIGSGVVLAFPAHMNQVLDFDSRGGVVVVEPGINFGRLQQALKTHGRFLPPYPANLEYSTVGGAVANNTGGEKSIKYGTMSNYVRGLRAVLANGEVIDVRRYNKRELGKKLGLSSFEGEIYRALDKLIEENHETISGMKLAVSKNSAGYNLADIKQKDGSFDLTPLLIGSQGTLGIITEVALDTVTYNQDNTLIAAFCNNLDDAYQVLSEVNKLPEPPSSFEVVDENVLNFVDKQNPNFLKGLIDKPFHKLVMFIEFDNESDRTRSKLVKRTVKILEKKGIEYQTETDKTAQEKLWKIRHATSSVLSYGDGGSKAVPVMDDGVVPVEKFNEYIKGVYEIFERNKLQAAVWGHMGNGNLHMQPYLDLSEVGDRQKAFKVMDEYYRLVISLGGSPSAEHGDGRIRAPYLPEVYGPEAYELLKKVKQIFDPYGILNPGVKLDVKTDDIKPLLRNEYSVDHQYDHLPRS